MTASVHGRGAPVRPRPCAELNKRGEERGILVLAEPDIYELVEESRVGLRRSLTIDLPSSRLADDWPPPSGSA